MQESRRQECPTKGPLIHQKIQTNLTGVSPQPAEKQQGNNTKQNSTRERQTFNVKQKLAKTGNKEHKKEGESQKHQKKSNHQTLTHGDKWRLTPLNDP